MPTSGSVEAFFKALPSIGLRSNDAAGKVTSPIEGVVVAPEALAPELSGLGAVVCVKASVTYEFDYAPRGDAFTIVMGGLESAQAKPGPIKAGAPVGLAPGREFFCVILADDPSPYLVVMSPRGGEKSGGRWWFDPSFLFSSGSTSWLSFRPIESLDYSVKSIGDHVSSESVSMQVFFEERYRFATSLDEYPSALTAEEAGRIAAYERSLYGREGVMRFGQRVQAGGYDVLLCWQGGFERYLADEYELGDRLWLFGNLATYDAPSKTAYFFIRDFSLESVEEMYSRKAPQPDA